MQPRGGSANAHDATLADGFAEPALLVHTIPGGGRTAAPSAPTLSFDVTPD
jgi:hypothetical protein